MQAKVKRLKWDGSFSITPINSYYIVKASNGSFFVNEMVSGCDEPDIIAQGLRTREDAKEEAQKAFEKMVLECLEK